jgi:hypothetical protein
MDNNKEIIETEFPIIKDGVKVQGVVIKQNDAGVLVSCSDNAFT